MRAIDAMDRDFLERTREHCSDFSQNMQFLRIDPLVIRFPGHGAPVSRPERCTRYPPRAGARPDDRDRRRPRCRRATCGASMFPVGEAAGRATSSNFDRSKRLRALVEDIHRDTGGL
jgi:hypothetical protein